ncbi:hypothetical protein B0H14DRAFT_2682249, partial [Mycena olivaceomarginata]
MSRSPPAFLYRLASTLSLVHIASGLATIFVYDVDDARYSQFIAVLYAMATFYMLSMLIPHTTQKDMDPVSRLNKQYVIVNFLLLCWVLSIGLVPLTVDAGITHTLIHCARASFPTSKCLTLALDMALPFALVETLGTSSYTIYRAACALQADGGAPGLSPLRLYSPYAQPQLQSVAFPPTPQYSQSQPTASAGLDESETETEEPSYGFTPFKLRPARPHGNGSSSAAAS